MTALDVLDVERIIRKAGADRVSEGAGRMLAEVLEEKATEIAERAVRLAKYANKKTLTRAEIEIALMYERDAVGEEVVASGIGRKSDVKRKPVPLAI
ncbi:Archaeal histone A [Candidatus Burarchaeum australiense]|nr:Archaeal histone A [Candidatus Burarchaeum australiense]